MTAAPELDAPRLPARVVNAAEARARFGTEADALFAALARTDPLADACAEALAGRLEAPAWLAAGCAGDDPEDAPSTVRAFFAAARALPAWADLPRADRGGRLLFRAGVAGGITLGAKSLVAGYCSPGGNKPLVFSGALEGQVQRRLAETGRFVVATCTPGGLHPGGEAWGITLRVRLMHAQVRRLLRRSGRWDAARWGAPINQHDMAATALLFGVVFVEGVRQFGVPVSRAEAEDYVHLWRLSSWLMGVEEALLPADEAACRRQAELIELTQGPPDEDARRLVRALLESPRGTLQAKGSAERLADWHVALGEGFCRALVGDARADALGLPRTPARFVVPTSRAILRTAQKALPRAARARAAARFEAFGRRYWARNLEMGLAGVPAAFRLPDALRSRPSSLRAG
ncbi:MAG TPA: oxygenase MpaB family protein [Polyangiaceae bacterium LLY-WYZ-15_(1-7)]|nr:oxygenase MpaB family protein [Polyangiaceae bacterium LLY-WYZ-15_(1-7)]